MDITIDDHPDLDAQIFVSSLPKCLGEMPSPAWLQSLLNLEADSPLSFSDETKAEVRNLLRHGGYKPTGRGKPASEYLVRAGGEGKLRSINTVVDCCNVVSLHAGLPISVVDLDKAQAPFRIGLAEPGTEYVFNPSGQVIKVSGLLGLHDAAGACANAVKDAQRTKTDENTIKTLTIIWGTNKLPGTAKPALDWYLGLLDKLGIKTEMVTQ